MTNHNTPITSTSHPAANHFSRGVVAACAALLLVLAGCGSSDEGNAASNEDGIAIVGGGTDNGDDSATEGTSPEGEEPGGSVAGTEGDGGEAGSTGAGDEGDGTATDPAVAAQLLDPELVRFAALELVSSGDAQTSTAADGAEVFETAQATVTLNVDNTVTYANAAGTETILIDLKTDRVSFVIEEPPPPPPVAEEVVGADGTRVDDFPAPLFEGINVRTVEKGTNSNGEVTYTLEADYPADMEQDVGYFYGDFANDYFDDVSYGAFRADDDSQTHNVDTDAGEFFVRVTDPLEGVPTLTVIVTEVIQPPGPDSPSVDALDLLRPGFRVTADDGTVIEDFPFALLDGSEVRELTRTTNADGEDVFNLVLNYPNFDDGEVSSYYSKLVRYGLNYGDTYGQVSSGSTEEGRTYTGSVETEEGQIYIAQNNEGDDVRVVITVGERPDGWVGQGE